MNICIDTNAYSEFKRGKLEVVSLFEEASNIIVPTIVIGELYAGFYIGTQSSRNIRELQEFLDQVGLELKAPDNEIAERYGIIVSDLKKKGTPIPTNDIWIAATALETGSRLVTYDNHFDLIPGLIILSP
ncbi:MAG: type II toxin-antitoxin system VapC family toxin [Fibrobacter sp.]|jgi:tRNA(fMet)-specific endonuclease VapC|nr:type II toxin-antitoxin system VapC family toxin [Fibrobacter sp.]HON12261.1 type II toxin-antitoxin system VapC family toxin [Chitinispirillaceae bacterium]